MEEELNNSLIIFEVFGLQYFSLKKLNVKELKARPSAVRLIYLIVLLFSMTIVAVWFVTTEAILDTNEKVTAKNVLTFAIQHSLNFGFILVIIASFIQSFLTTSNVKKIYFNLKEIADIALEHFNMRMDYKEIRKTLSRRLTVVIIIFLILYFSIFFVRSGPKNDMLTIFVGIIPLLLLLLVAYKFVFYVAMVNCHLRIIQKLLNEIFRHSLVTVKTIDRVNIQTLNIQAIKKYENPIRKLLGVRQAYNLVYEIGILINESNGFTREAAMGWK